MRFVLVHSPLVGPGTWRWVAAALEDSDHEVVVPDLRSASLSGQPDSVVEAAVAAVPSQPVVLVGHSGAGFFLPSMVARLDTGGMGPIFVDAGLPPSAASATPSADFLDRLRVLAVSGRLPKWSTWWGDLMKTLVPDESRRSEIEGEMPEVPLAFYETRLDLPADWESGGGSFLLLSEPYRPEAERARSLGWVTVERMGNHLDIVNEPEAIAEVLVALALANRDASTG